MNKAIHSFAYLYKNRNKFKSYAQRLNCNPMSGRYSSIIMHICQRFNIKPFSHNDCEVCLISHPVCDKINESL